MTNKDNVKFPTSKNPRWEPNEDINEILGLIDFVTDEYGNYYTPYKISTDGGKLTEVTLVHVLYDEAFSTIFQLDEVLEGEYRFKHLGNLLLDRMNGHIKELEKNKRKIFTIQDLFENGTKVYTWDITKPKS
ncbi:hypothetical protein [Oceanobacillus oncorhynchi]|uniref:hypothetical protein n=1 Tax=Oceanobacillus oncorhynchi TaxID=545501 RepID=UPI0034D6692C